MPDSPDQLPPAPPLRWLRELLRSTRLTRYRQVRKRARVLELLALSGEEGTPGVLSDTDGAIAAAIGFHENLDHLHELLDEMIAKKDLRAVMVDGVRRYEFSRRLLPAYQGDFRQPEPWDMPRPVMTVAATPSVLEMTPEDIKRGGNRKWEIEATAAEKQAFSRFCRARRLKAEQEGWTYLPLNRDKWVAAYRAQALESTDSVTFEIAENAQSKSNTDAGKSNKNETEVTFDVTFASRDDEFDDDVTFEREKETHHHHSETEPKVTEAKVTEAKVTEGKSNTTRSNAPSEVRNEEVFAYLTGEGLWPDAAGPASTWCSLEDAQIYVAWSQNDAVKSKARGKDDSDPMTLLRYKLENRLPIAPAMRQGYHQTLKGKRCQEEAQKTAERDAETAERVLAAFGMMEEHERLALCFMVAREVWNGRGNGVEMWREFATQRGNNPNKRPKPPLQAILDRKIAECIISERGWTPVVPETKLPPMWQMPPDWDGFN